MHSRLDIYCNFIKFFTISIIVVSEMLHCLSTKCSHMIHKHTHTHMYQINQFSSFHVQGSLKDSNSKRKEGVFFMFEAILKKETYWEHVAYFPNQKLEIPKYYLVSSEKDFN